MDNKMKYKDAINSEEFKKKFDEFVQKRMGLSYEDFRVEKGTKRIEKQGVFLVDYIQEDIGLQSLQGDLPMIAEIDEVFTKMKIREKDVIKATLFSDVDENGMTSEWFFKEIKRLDKNDPLEWV